MTKIEKLLIELLKIDSATGNEKELAEKVITKLKGFKIEKQQIGKGRFNVIAKKGNSKKWIVCHLDTVPGRVPIKVTGERIYGRGACDNKGNLAGAILVAKKLNDINLLFTVDEEADLMGAKKAKIKGERVVVMEPTMLEVMTGQMGLVAFKITTKGKEQHTSLNFDLNGSAIHKLIGALSELQKKKFNAFNVGKIVGGVADNVVAGKAEADVVIRPKSENEFNEILTSLSKTKKDFDCQVKMRDKFKPFFSNLPGEERLAPFFSEMIFFENSLLFGAGSIEQAHTENEFILRKQLNQLEKRLGELINEQDT